MPSECSAEQKTRYTIRIYCDLEKYVALDAEDDEEAYQYIEAALENGLVELDVARDLDKEDAVFFDITDGESSSDADYDDSEDEDERFKELDLRFEEERRRLEELTEEVYRKGDYSSYWVVRVVLPLTTIVTVEAASSEEAGSIVQEAFDAGKVELTTDDLAEWADEEDPFELEAVKYEVAADWFGIDVDDCEYLPTKLFISEEEGLVAYYGPPSIYLEEDKVGKWVFRFDNRDDVELTCYKAVKSGAAPKAAHTDADRGLGYFFSNYDDEETMALLVYVLFVEELVEVEPGVGIRDQRFVMENPNSTVDIRLSDYINCETGKPKGALARVLGEMKKRR